jgi:hypothetical protein
VPEDKPVSVTWTAEAEIRLAHVPPFIRSFVRRRAESHALETGAGVVTAELLHALARRRFSKTAATTFKDGRPVGRVEELEPGALP